MQMLKLEQLEADRGGGGGGKPAPAPAAAAKPPVSDNKPAEDDAFDDLGYAKEPPADGAASASKGTKDEGGEGGKKSEPQKAADEKDITPASGYSDDPEKVEDPPAPEPEKKAEEIDLGFKLDSQGLADDEFAKLKKEAKDLELSEAQAKKFVEKRKSELKAAEEAKAKAEADFKKEQEETRKRWHSELKSDPVFGGENFGFNVKRAEKVIEEFMPNTKKVLTERKSMLPPYVMRDLAKLGNHLYSTESLKTGNPPAPPAQNEEQDDALDFYNT